MKKTTVLLLLLLSVLACSKNDNSNGTKETRFKVVLTKSCSLRFIGDENNNLEREVHLENPRTFCSEFHFDEATLDFYTTSNDNYGSDGFTYYKGNLKEAFNSPESPQYALEEIYVQLPNYRIRRVVVTQGGTVNVLYEVREGDARDSEIFLSRINNTNIQSTVNLTEVASIGPGSFDGLLATFLHEQDKILFVEQGSHLNAIPQIRILDLNTLEFTVEPLDFASNPLGKDFDKEDITSVFYSPSELYFIVLKTRGSFETFKEIYDGKGVFLGELNGEILAPTIAYDKVSKEFDYVAIDGKVGVLDVDVQEVKRTGTVEHFPGGDVMGLFYYDDE